MKKKGSLSLSINAVVVLVLAIALLGLGLAFTKGMFDRLKGNLIDAIQPPKYDATSEEPIVLSTGNIPLKKGQNSRIPLSFFNNYEATEIVPSMRCRGEDGSMVEWAVLEPAIVAVPQTVQSGSAKGFAISVDYDRWPFGASGTPTFRAGKTYVCNIVMEACTDDPADVGCYSPTDPGEGKETLQVLLEIQ